MSFDRKIDFVCPHHVVEEALFIRDDRVTVSPLRPISSATSVRVRINGLAEIPSPGIHTSATVTVAKRGPFNVVEGTSNQLVIGVDALPDQTLTITGGQQLSARLIAAEIGSRITGVSVGVSEKGRLTFKTERTGKAATLTIRSAGSTLAPILGLPTDRQFRGRQVAPGWSLIKDPSAIETGGRRFVVFDSPLQGLRNFVELNYATLRTECRRCGGLGVENDWRYNINGDVIEVRNEALLLQEIQKIMFTSQGSNPFHTWYGTGILDTVGKKLSAAGLVQSFIISDVRDAFRRWQNVKNQQEQIGQFVSDQEYPFQLLQVNLEPDPSDPTILYVNSTIRNRSQEPLQIERGVRLPLPADILGGTVQDGLIRQSIEGSGFKNSNSSGTGNLGQGQFQGVFPQGFPTTLIPSLGGNVNDGYSTANQA